MNVVAHGLLLSIVAASPGAAADAAYPRKPIRWVVPFVLSSGTDILARAIAPDLTRAWGVPVVVDNRPGAGGTDGSKLVAQADPDGHTLLLANVAAIALAPAMRSRTPYDPLRDLTPITQLAATANLMVAVPALEVRTVEELLAYARAHPGTVKFASGGLGTAGHLAGELLQSMARVSLTHVPYPGSPAAMTALFAGAAQISFTSLVSTLPHVQAGRLRALAVTTLKRTRVLPGVPTLHESGVPGFEVSGWQGVFAPRNVPPAIALKLQAAIAAILDTPDVAERLAAQGLDPVASTPEAFRLYLESEVPKWSALIRGLKITPETD